MAASTSPPQSIPGLPAFSHGTGSLIPGDWSLAIVHLLILGVRSLPILCALYLATTLFASSSFTEAVLADFFPVSIVPRSLAHLLHRYVLTPWAIIEVLFAIYHATLVARVQSPGPKPLYSRQFLDQVFARALSSGLGLGIAGLAGGAQNECIAGLRRESQNGSNSLTLPQPGRDPGRETQDDPTILTLPQPGRDPEQWFHDLALRPTDPRAVKFQRDQAMWFHVPRDADSKHLITRRDGTHWLAWSLFSCPLEDLEEEHRMLHQASITQVQQQLDQTYLTVEKASRQDGAEEDPDLKKVLASPSDWTDIDRGTRLDYLRKARRIVEARQGFRYPLTRGGPEGPDEELDMEGASINALSTGSMRLTIDPVQVQARPLLAYCLTQGLSYLTLRYAVRKGGFTLHTEGRLSYLVKIPRGWSAAKASDPTTRGRYRPTLFLHGLGIGLAQYHSLISHLARCPLTDTHPLMIPLQPHISQNIFSKHFLHPLGHHETVAALLRAMKKLQWEEVQILSHSMGTIVHAWLLKSLGSKVARSCFVDPVCFRLFIPDVCGNFVYLAPDTPIKLLMRFFVGRELGTANTLCRYFDWASAILWPEDEIPNLTDPKKTKFFLAGQDAILNAKETREYLLEFGAEEVIDEEESLPLSASPSPSPSPSPSLSPNPSRPTTPSTALDPKRRPPIRPRAPSVIRRKRGGLIVDWKSAHGELLMKDGPGIDVIVDWLLELDPELSSNSSSSLPSSRAKSRSKAK